MEAKLCFNPNCKESSEKWRTGWRRRSGEYANLCDRCSSAYEEGKFCEMFHLKASGWRCCESCGKNIHCGCIVSFHTFVLLDAGGIECLTCAKKSYISTPNPAWPPPSHFLPSKTKRMKDLSVRTSSELAGPGPVPWLQAPSMFSGSNSRIDVRPMMPLVNDVSGGIDREKLSTPPVMDQETSYESVVNGKPGLWPFEKLQNGNTGPNAKEQFYSSPSMFPPIVAKADESSSFMNLVTASSSKVETKDTQLSAVLSQPASVSILLGKHVSSHNVRDSSSGTQIRNGKARGDGRGRNQLLPRYHPQITDEELQQIISDPKSVITPLFEKILTASDAGRIGRLVLPKKCAEAYFPSIAHPEGLPLKVQDVKGNEWVFQFRFWPNNNSRMYVLEGITPCIQSMQLQAGDVVTFSRLEPEGKLVMGGRKARTVEGDEGTINGSDSTLRDDISRDKSGEVSVYCHVKGKSSNNIWLINQAAKAGTGNAWSKIDSSGFTGKRVLEPKPVIHGKRKNSSLCAKSKRLKIESEDMIVLDLTWHQAQGLMRPPAKSLPSVFIVEGCKFEEFEESAPVIGRPTIPGIDQLSEKTQWVQCEDCFKWRKVPADAFLPSRWICMENVWDPDRSFCSAAEELAIEQLEDMLLAISKVSFEKEITGQDPSPFVALEGLDTRANLGTEGEGQSLPTSTKYPCHRHGCTCAVCLQPPSGKTSNHDQSCNCVVCCSLNHSFRTLMRRHEDKQSDKEPESAFQKLQCQQLPEEVQVDPYSGTLGKDNVLNQEGLTNLNSLDEYNWNGLSASLLKGHIDLNIHPTRDEETSLHSKARPTMPSVIGNLVGERMQQGGVGSSGFGSCTVPNDGNQKPDHIGPSCTSV